MRTRAGLRRWLVVVAGAAVAAGCSTPAYTRSDALSDLEADTSLSTRQSRCLLDGIEDYFADQYKRLQAENGDDDVSDAETEVYVKNQLSAEAEPDAATVTAFDKIRARCS